MSDFSDRKLISISHHFLSHYTTRLSYSNHPKSNLWRLRVWSSSLYNILYSVLGTWFLNFVVSQNVCTNILEETLVTTGCADSSVLVSDTASFVEDFRRFVLDDLKLKEGITTFRDVWQYPMKQHWKTKSFLFRGGNLRSRPLRVSDVNTLILKTGFERRLSGSG
jgi:hypothetical protein